MRILNKQGALNKATGTQSKTPLKLRTQLTFAFSFLAILCVLLIGIFANWQLEIHFREYIKQSQLTHLMTTSINTEVYYNEVDLHFIQTLNRVLYSVGAIVLLIAISLGAFLSKRITKPIINAIRGTEAIGNGQWRLSLEDMNSSKELMALTTAVNHLGISLEKQENLRKRLTADVAHELRTPLATLQSHLEAMIDGVWEPTEERLSSIHEEVVRITRLVGDLEKLDRYESEQLVLGKSDVDLKHLAEQMKVTFDSSARQKKVNLEVSGSSVFVLADSDKVAQIMVNLLSNALKFTHEGDSIEIRISETVDGALVEVIDTGQGIASEDLPFIFERFYRADLSRARATGGTGIGLSLVKAIAEAHDGWVTAESELGRGTTMRLFLPK